MNAKKTFYLLVAGFALLSIAIIAATVLGNSLLQKESAKLMDLKVQNLAVEKEQQALATAKRELAANADLEALTKSVVPQDKDQAKTVREIVNIANQSRVPIKSISFETSNLGDIKAATPGGGAANAKLPPISQAKAVEGITGVYTVPIQVTSAAEVDYDSFIRFLQGLENNRRTAHVETIDITPKENIDGSKINVNFTLVLNAYVKP